MLYDKDIREPLFEFLEEKYGKTRFIEEKVMGRSRADVLMVTIDSFWGIEIKSDADTYARLDRQVKDYNRFFDYNIIVVGESHKKNIAEHVPEYWGIISVNDNGAINIEVIREAQPNPKREKLVKLRNQLSMLWRPELSHIQQINDMPKYKYLSKINVIKKIMEKVPVDKLKVQMSEELFQRDYTTIAKVIEEYKK